MKSIIVLSVLFVLPVSYGNTDLFSGKKTNGYNNVRKLKSKDGICTATLVGAGTYLTAAHCVSNEMSFNEKMGWMFPVKVEHTYIYPGYNPSLDAIPYSERRKRKDEISENTKSDLALLITHAHDTSNSYAVIDVTSTPNEGTEATLVGFGDNDHTGGSGIKRFGTAKIVKKDNSFIYFADRFQSSPVNVAGSHGDSGGPVLIENKIKAVMVAKSISRAGNITIARDLTDPAVISFLNDCRSKGAQFTLSSD